MLKITKFLTRDTDNPTSESFFKRLWRGRFKPLKVLLVMGFARFVQKVCFANINVFVAKFLEERGEIEEYHLAVRCYWVGVSVTFFLMLYLIPPLWKSALKSKYTIEKYVYRFFYVVFALEQIGGALFFSWLFVELW